MLEIKKISKVYVTDDLKQVALDDISVNFRNNEFASILGPSGSGKTTLLNIIGGLDQYDKGDLIINEVSTKKFKDRDWDSYRNHRVGFVFQSYNLISHQSVLKNVELALTLSGVSQSERTKRAKKALKDVGLEKHINKRPNQLSGGQMQRVAIARALVNDPDIVLADEPTGALDSETSKQIMEILKKISNDKLVIMVTHNPEIAEKYSTRIIKLKDGKIIDDSNPYDGKINTKETLENEIKKSNKTVMSSKTAFSLSLNNLMTKKGRTILTAFAGSIGIIGIALIMSLSNGLNSYIKQVEEDTLSSYPLTLDKTTVDQMTLMETLLKNNENINTKFDKIYSNNIMSDMLASFAEGQNKNNLKEFKKYIEDSNIYDYVSDIKYKYNFDLNIYLNDNNEYIKVNPSTVLENIGINNNNSISVSVPMNEMDSFQELTNNKDLLEDQYDLLYGKYPEEYNEVVLVLDKNNQISDYALYSLGILDQNELKETFKKIMIGEEIEKKDIYEYKYEEIVGLKYKLLLNTDIYKKINNIWIDKSDDEEYMKNILDKSIDIEVVGIIKISENSSLSTTGVIGYTNELTKYTIDKINESKIVNEQKNNKSINVFTGLEFSDKEFNIEDLPKEEQQYLLSLSKDELDNLIKQYSANSGATYEENLIKMGSVDIEDPDSILLYPIDFEAKDNITNIINDYNDTKDEKDKIIYTDLVGVMMKSVTTIINSISYILMAFVSISLIVSSIMIAIITYISVIERTKEIGILRAIGASKKDVSRVFNAETFIEGLFSGVLGISVTILLNIPINIIINNITGINNLSKLPVVGALILVLISIILTLIAGLIPAKMASKKEPVEALRTE